MTRQRVYDEPGRPVEVLTWWGPGGGPCNVLIRRARGMHVVRLFRGLRRRPRAFRQAGTEAGE